MYYGYSQDQNWSTVGATRFSSFNDPSTLGLMPAAALLYRQGHVAPANNTYELQLNRNDFFFIRQDPRTSKTVRTLMEKSRFTIGLPHTSELPWVSDNTTPAEAGTIIITNANQDFIPANQSFVESDTQELKRDWDKGIHTINTEKSQIISGWVGGEVIDLDDVTFSMTTSNAVVAVQSLENKAIRQSKKIFITLMAQSQTENGRKLPFISEPVTGQVEIHAPQGLSLYPIDKNGNLANKINIPYNSSEGKYTVSLAAGTETHWYLLQETLVPGLRITFPTNGETFKQGDLIAIKTNTTEFSKAITSVAFSYNNTAIGTISTAPYEIFTQDLPIGSHTLKAHLIFDDNSSEDAQISVTVTGVGQATFTISQPLDNADLIEGQPVTIKTNALESEGHSGNIDKVVFWKDAWLYLGEKSTVPYEFTIPSNSLPLGEHLLRARVVLTDGTFKNSQISVTVVNATQNTPFQITQPLNNASFIEGQAITIKTNALNAVDNAGNIKEVIFWKDAFIYLGKKTASPYEITLPNTSLSVGDHLLRARIVLNDNSFTDFTLTIKVTASPTDPTPDNINMTPLILLLFS
jgi:hypothetical protein